MYQSETFQVNTTRVKIITSVPKKRLKLVAFYQRSRWEIFNGKDIETSSTEIPSKMMKQCRIKKKPLTVDEGKAKENDIEQDLREMSSDDLPFQWSFLIHLWHPRHRYLYANKTLNTCGKWFAKIHNFLERFIYKSCICVNT